MKFERVFSLMLSFRIYASPNSFSFNFDTWNKFAIDESYFQIQIAESVWKKLIEWIR